jgi:hypothetical protein
MWRQSEQKDFVATQEGGEANTKASLALKPKRLF